MIESNKRKDKFLKWITLLEKLYKFNFPFHLFSPLSFSDSLSARKFVVRRSWSLKFWLESSEIGRETRRYLSLATSFTWDRWRSDPITRIATLLSSPQLYSSSRSHPGCLHSFMRFHNFKFHQQTHWLKRAGMRVNDGKNFRLLLKIQKTLSYTCYNRPIHTRKLCGITTQKAHSL